ncbi:disulfide bond formation protein DsbB [Arsukibacterium indicum]|uniref:Disulfide bond formation protein B n=1 Tax=Arsukibacterium indicum TaxID=2848612 RepID=A0ABS6MFQ6_9GAMM|nr:disulfide bond formation protein DsbB [Arsukibacterium indicum]MBV2127651.1 disulfide bond formation protein DsbB [Arsukibacterium indicum]
MLATIKKISRHRLSWFLLLLSALALLASGLYFQYGLNLQPCIKCIYIRAAFAGILLAGLLGLLAPKNGFLRILAIALWLISAGIGLYQAMELVNIEQTLAAGGFSSCALFAEFPAWLALDKWLPAVFEVTGSCGGVDWQFAGLSMAYWSMLISGAYLLSAAIVLVGQFGRISNNPYR